MPEEIVAQPDMPIYYFMAVVSVWSIVLMAIFLVMLTKGPQMLDAAIAWCRQTFTRAGDGCIDCNRVTMTADCQTCGTRRTFTPGGVTTARIPRPRRSESADVFNIDAERRRLAALAMISQTPSGRVM